MKTFLVPLICFTASKSSSGSRLMWVSPLIIFCRHWIIPELPSTLLFLASRIFFPFLGLVQICRGYSVVIDGGITLAGLIDALGAFPLNWSRGRTGTQKTGHSFSHLPADGGSLMHTQSWQWILTWLLRFSDSWFVCHVQNNPTSHLKTRVVIIPMAGALSDRFLTRPKGKEQRCSHIPLLKS